MGSYISEGMRQVCEDYFPHDCQTCEFEFIKGGSYCPKDIVTPCPNYGISEDAFCEALAKWKHDHPGQDVDTYGNKRGPARRKPKNKNKK